MVASLRRSVPSLTLLIGLLVGVALLAAVRLGAPLWWAPAFALVLVGVQFAVAPWLIQRLVRHDWVPEGSDHPLVRIVERQAQAAGVPMPRLAVVDDGMPNAFTFGHVPGDARVFVTRGLLERLDERELEAVVAHELGHIRHFDMALMTLASAVPLTLYWIYLTLRSASNQTKAVAVVSYVAYLASQMCLLAFARSRETAADLWSCRVTGDGDALASALVKVGYGCGQVRAEEQTRARALVASGKQGKKEAARHEKARAKTGALRAMGVFDPKEADALAVAVAGGIDPAVALGGLRWDVHNPWGRTLELFSSHPLVATRIATLERSGLPGAPSTWSVLRATADVTPEQRQALRRAWSTQVALDFGPWAILLVALTGAGLSGSRMLTGLVLVAGSATLLAKQLVRYPRHGYPACDGVATLLTRLDASPVAGIPVELRGRIVGRAMPGYVLSPDLALQDDSGIVPVRYRQPLPFARLAKALTGVDRLLGREVVARGWYHRGPGPQLELHELEVAGRVEIRTWWWAACYAGAALVGLAGVVVLALGAAT